MASQGLQDLMLALQSFNSGLKSLQTSRVLNNANEAVEQIRASDIDAQQKKTQIKGIAEQLSMKLIGLGGSVDEAAKVAQMFEGPKMQSADNPFQLFHQSMATGDTEGAKLALQWEGLKDTREAARQDRQDTRFLQGLDAAEQRQSRSIAEKRKSFLNDQYKDFRDKTAKANLQAIDKLNNISALQSLPEDKRKQSAIGLVQRSLVGLTGDARVSDQDADAIGLDPSIWAKVKRNIGLMSEGKPPEPDFEEYDALAGVLGNANKRAIVKKAKGFSKNRYKFIPDYDEESLYKDLLTETNLIDFAQQDDGSYDFKEGSPSMTQPGSAPSGQQTSAPQPSGSKLSKYIK